uniref:Uncharacterized protein n=1 Tax=Arundo donax TaxID=35708 RepID=A0A0A9L1G3_ARUDO
MVIGTEQGERGGARREGGCGGGARREEGRSGAKRRRMRRCRAWRGGGLGDAERRGERQEEDDWCF